MRIIIEYEPDEPRPVRPVVPVKKPVERGVLGTMLYEMDKTFSVSYFFGLVRKPKQPELPPW